MSRTVSTTVKPCCCANVGHHQWHPHAPGECPDRRVAWRVRGELHRRAGHAGTPAWRWAIHAPNGARLASTARHILAINSAQSLAVEGSAVRR